MTGSQVIAMSVFRPELVAFLMIVLAATGSIALACDQTTVNVTHQADVTCYGALPNGSGDSAPAINAAARAAVAQHVPLVIPAARYKVFSTIDIDYAAASDTGIEVQANGAILDGYTINGAPVLYVHCSGGSPQSPKSCFYFHQSGTLHVYANSPGMWAAVIGDWGFADAQNSIKLDHIIVNNAASESGALLLNYVLNAEVFTVADAGGSGSTGLWLNQVQFSTVRGAASGGGGWALSLGNGYTFANTLQGLDLEASQWCIVNISPSSAHNTFVSPYLNCIGGVYSAAGTGNILLNPLFGGATQIPTWISAGFKVMQ
jgi:hypothetical protein